MSTAGRPTNPVRGIGPADAKLIIIGEGPGPTEQRRGEPFVGASGIMLGQAMDRVGVKRADVYITNTTLCVPPQEGKDAAVKKAAECCRPRLEREINAVSQTAPVLAVGKFAAQSFIADKAFKITEMAGAYFKVEFGGVPREVIPTIHPAALIRNRNDEAKGSDLGYWNLIYDIQKAWRLGNGKQRPLAMEPDTEYTNPKRAGRLIEAFARSARVSDGIVAADSETLPVAKEDCKLCLDCDGHEAIEPRHAKLHAIGLATSDYAVSVLWRLLDTTAINVLKRLAGDPKLRFVFQNRVFDKPLWNRHGIEFANEPDDTLLMHHCVFPGLPHKLQRIVTQFFISPPWKSEFRNGEGTDADLTKYCGLDTFGTRKAVSPLRIGIGKEKVEKAYESDIKMAMIAEHMHEWGIPVNLDVNRTMFKVLEPRLKEKRAALLEMVGGEVERVRFLAYLAYEKAKTKRKKDSDDLAARRAKRFEEAEEAFEDLDDGLNLNSPAQVVAMLKALGVPLTQTTRKKDGSSTGRISTKKDYLEALSGHPAVRALLDFRGLDKQISTFIEPIPHEMDRAHRTHPIWSVNKISGRWGSRRNWQNWSKGNWMVDKFTTPGKVLKPTFDAWVASGFQGLPNLRWQCTPLEPGRILIGWDFAQLEARIVAMLAGEIDLCKALIDNIDVHTIHAIELLGEARWEALAKDERKEWRQRSKPMFYGYVYGAAPTTVWATLVKDGVDDVPYKMVQDFFMKLRKRYPRIAAYHVRLLGDTRKALEVRDFLMGRRRCFPTGNVPDTEVKNFVAQAGGASIMNTGISRLWDELKNRNFYVHGRRPGAKLLIQGHDAITIECDEDDVEELGKLGDDCLTQEYTVNGVMMRYTVERDVGRSWAET